jgi:hypothetical protein
MNATFSDNTPKPPAGGDADDFSHYLGTRRLPV